MRRAMLLACIVLVAAGCGRSTTSMAEVARIGRRDHAYDGKHPLVGPSWYYCGTRDGVHELRHRTPSYVSDMPSEVGYRVQEQELRIAAPFPYTSDRSQWRSVDSLVWSWGATIEAPLPPPERKRP